jgi:hypothetical protein
MLWGVGVEDGSCNLGRFCSGCFGSLSCVATEASLGVLTVLSVSGGGVVSRFRLFEGRGVNLFLWEFGVVTEWEANVSSFKLSAACWSLLVAFSSSSASRMACCR